MFKIGDEVVVIDGVYRGDHGRIVDGPVDLRTTGCVWVWLEHTSGHRRPVRELKLAHRATVRR
ncbi:KOW motif-containing protein [Amycolatopsis anabasis]|uniref:KOW motif-containing protein n=1 Tax=Amycolatopsis anabasis TaxID=1840409 RepID=UPI00131DB742|nr:KOW motif-containing protein [Amycolatopsis anabasis]